MPKKPDDSLSRALTLLQQTAGNPRPSGLGDPPDSGPADILELFLAELKMRRAHLREWIDMLSREADRNPDVPVR